jgi:hypothetical protein
MPRLDFSKTEAESCYADMLTQDKRLPFYMLGDSTQEGRVGKWVAKKQERSNRGYRPRIEAFMKLIRALAGVDKALMDQWEVTANTVLDKFVTREALVSLGKHKDLVGIFCGGSSGKDEILKSATSKRYMKGFLLEEIKRRVWVMDVNIRRKALKSMSDEQISLSAWKYEPVVHTCWETMFDAVRYAQSSCPSRPGIQHRLNLEKDAAVATDGHRLVRVPTKDIPEGVYIRNKGEKVARIIETDKFPCTKQILGDLYQEEKCLKHGWLVDITVLVSQLKFIQCRDKDLRFGSVVLQAQADQLFVIIEQRDKYVVGNYIGDNEEKIFEEKFALNARYLEEALNHCTGDYALISVAEEFTGVGHPIQVLGQNGHFCLIMPMRL